MDDGWTDPTSTTPALPLETGTRGPLAAYSFGIGLRPFAEGPTWADGLPRAGGQP